MKMTNVIPAGDNVYIVLKDLDEDENRMEKIKVFGYLVITDSLISDEIDLLPVINCNGTLTSIPNDIAFIGTDKECNEYILKEEGK